MLAERKIEQTGNVVSLEHYISDYFYEFIKDKQSRSENTAKAYKSDIEQFFKVVFDKKIEAITVDHMASLKGNDIIKYRNIIGEKYANSTVNRKIKSIRSFFAYIEADHEEVRQAIFNSAKNLKQEDSNSWGNLTHDEIVKMISVAEDIHKHMAVLIELGYNTSIRLDALLQMTEENVFRREKNGIEFWTVEVIDKSSKNIKPISEDMKAKLFELDYKKRFFATLSKHKVGDLMKEVCRASGIDFEKRNIRFHSIKKAGVNHVLQRTGDIKLAQKQGNHKSATTTLNAYLEEVDDITKLPSMVGMGNDVDISELGDMTKEEIMGILNELSSGAKLEILRLMLEK